MLQLLRNRPRLGRPEEASWYDTVDDIYPAVRASLQSFLAQPDDHEALIEGAALLWYWYYRTKVHEGERWLQEAVAVAGAGPPSVLIRMAHAAALFLLDRSTEGRRVLESALLELDAAADGEHILAVPMDRLTEVMVGTAGSIWTVNDFPLMRQMIRRLVLVEQVANDPDLKVVVAGAACASRLDSEDLAAVARDARGVHNRAVAIGNLCAIWEACAVLNIVALLTSDAEAGLLWTDRVIEAHRQLGTGGGGVYLEALANFLLMSGELEQAVEMYAAAYTHNRRAGMTWPARPATQDLFDSAIKRLPEADYQRAWNIGEGLSLHDVAARRRSASKRLPK